MFLKILALREHYAASRSHPFRLTRRAWVYFFDNTDKFASNVDVIFEMIHPRATAVMGALLC